MAQSRKIRVILDTNVFVAAFWNRHSRSARILEAIEEGRLVLGASPAIEREILTVLQNAKASAAFRRRIEKLLEAAMRVHPESRARLSADPDDNKFS